MIQRGARRLGVVILCLFAIAAHAQPLASGLATIDVEIEGTKLRVEVARTPVAQHRGLGGRTWIDPNGGMLFPFAAPRRAAFVMRDCPIAIDLAFLDAAGRVLAIHEMKPEPPRAADESAESYEQRLRPYASGAPASYALETAGGRMRELGLDIGDRVLFDRADPALR
jgi:hypothetical protein